MLKKSIKAKLILLLSLLLICTVLISLFSTNWIVEKSQHEMILDSVVRTEQVLENVLERQRFNLQKQAQLIGILPILATVVENGDPATILNTSQSYQQDLELPIFDVLDDEGELLVSVNSNFTLGESSQSLISQVLEGESGATLGIREKQLVLLAAAPIGLPDEPSGVLLIGFYLNNNFSEIIKKLTQTDILFLINHNPTGSSLSPEMQNLVLKDLQLMDLEKEKDSLIKNDTQMLKIKPLQDVQQNTVGQVIIHISLEDFNNTLRNIHYLMIAIGIAIFCIFITIGYIFTSETIVKPITSMVEVFKDIAEGEGDLTKRLPTNSQDEIGELAHWFNIFLDKLAEIIAQIKENSEMMAASAEKSSGMANQMIHDESDVALRIKQEFEALTQFSKFLKQTNNATHSIADLIREVVSEADQTNTTVNSANESVTKAVVTMKRIEDQSQKIEGIIQLITKISGQTNLLSLNAAIEAAKAGDQGKGFAVVADEVRHLAESSSNATIEIRKLIENSNTEIAEGTSIINTSGSHLEQILKEIQGIVTPMHEISNSITEQEEGVNENTKTMETLSKISAENVDSIDQLLSSTEKVVEALEMLSQLSNKLRQLAAQFKISV